MKKRFFILAVSVVFVLCAAIYWYIAIFQYNEPENKKDPSQGTQGINVGKNDVDGPLATTEDGEPIKNDKDSPAGPWDGTDGPLATTEDGEPIKNDKDSPAGPWDGTGDDFKSAPPVITDPETDEPIDSPAPA